MAHNLVERRVCEAASQTGWLGGNTAGSPARILTLGGVWLGFFVGLFTGSAAAVGQVTGSRLSGPDLQATIADLQSLEFNKREAATQRLAAAGFDAMQQILPLLTADDAEVAWRSKEILIQQGVRGDEDAVRRIGLVLHLLTAAGYTQFSDDATEFASRVARLRLTDTLKQLEAMPELMIVAGPEMGAVIVGGNMLRLQGNVIIAQQPAIEIRPEAMLRGMGGGLGGGRRRADWLPVEESGEGNSEQAEGETAEGDEAEGGEASPAGMSPAAQRRAVIEAETPQWLAQCLSSTDAELTALESTWRDLGILAAPDQSLEQGGQVFEMHVVKALTPEKLAVLDQFFANRVIVSLNLQEIDLSPEFQNVILDAAEAGKIQYLNTVKCRYDLATYKKLNEFNRNGRLGYWNSQGRAMLGIRTDSLIVGGNARGQMGGALVGTVTVPSAAAAAGILAGDIITKVNDVSVENFEELRRIVAAFDVGDTIQVSVERSGLPQPLTLAVELMQHAQ